MLAVGRSDAVQRVQCLRGTYVEHMRYSSRREVDQTVLHIGGGQKWCHSEGTVRTWNVRRTCAVFFAKRSGPVLLNWICCICGNPCKQLFFLFFSFSFPLKTRRCDYFDGLLSRAEIRKYACFGGRLLITRKYACWGGRCFVFLIVFDGERKGGEKKTRNMPRILPLCSYVLRGICE